MALRSFWFTLLFASLLFVGCGTDEPAEQAAKNDEKAQPKDGKDTPGDNKKKTPADDDEPKIAFDVSYITEEYVAAIAIRPSGIVGTPLVADVRKLLKAQLGDEFPLDRNISKFQDMFGFDPQQVEEIIILVDQQMVAAGPGMFAGGRDEEFIPESVPSEVDEIPSKSDGGADSDDDDADVDDAKGDKVPTAPSKKDAPKSELFDSDPPPQDVERKQPPLPTAIIRFGQKIDREELLKPIRDQVRQLGELIEKQHAGYDYLVSSKAGLAAHFPDDQTVVVAPEESLKKMLTAKNVDSPLIRQLKSVGQHQLVVAVDVAAMSAMVTGLAAAGPEGVGQVAEKVKGVTLTLDFDRKSLLKLSVLAGSASDATEIAKAAQGYLAIGQGFYALSKGQQLENATPEQRQLMPILDSLVAGTGVAQNGTTITLTIKTPDGLEKLPELLKPFIAQAKAAAERSRKKSDFKQILLAMHNYHETYNFMPTADGPGHSDDKIKSGLLSWRVYLLPMLDEPGLYNQFHLDEPWDSEHNKTLIKRMPKVFGNDPEGKTSVHVFIGEGTPFGGKRGPKFRDITDGISNTLAIVEAGPDKAEIWTKPGGLPFDPKNPMAALGKIGETFLAAVLDGSVHNITGSIDADTMSKLIRHDDGVVVEIP